MADVQLRVSSLTAKRAHYPIARYLSYALHLLLVTPLNFHNYPRADYVFENAIGQKITAFRPRQATSWIGKLINGDSSGGGSGKSISSILMILRLIKFSNLSLCREGRDIWNMVHSREGDEEKNRRKKFEGFEMWCINIWTERNRAVTRVFWGK